MTVNFKKLEQALIQDISLHKAMNTKPATIRYETSILDFKQIAKKLGISEVLLRSRWKKKNNMKEEFFTEIVKTFNLKL